MPTKNSGLRRYWRHVVGNGRWALKPTLSAEDFTAIEAAIAKVEASHHGEICFAVEAALAPSEVFDGLSPRQRALAVFSELRIWDTEHNNGVLLYLLLADHAVEIVADRAAARLATQAEWDALCEAMRAEFRQGQFRSGVLAAVAGIAALLARDGTAATGRPRSRNELPNTAVLRRE